MKSVSTQRSWNYAQEIKGQVTLIIYNLTKRASRARKVLRYLNFPRVTWTYRSNWQLPEKTNVNKWLEHLSHSVKRFIYLLPVSLVLSSLSLESQVYSQMGEESVCEMRVCTHWRELRNHKPLRSVRDNKSDIKTLLFLKV